MLRNTTYEVWVQSGTRWEIHSRFPVRDHDKALEEAKDLEHYNPQLNVRVVREDYDPETGLAEELVVYASPRRRRPVAGGGVSSWAGAGNLGRGAYSGRFQTAAVRKTISRTTLLIMMCVWTVIGGSIATVITYVAAVAAPGLFLLDLATREARNDALFALFMIVFAGSALVLNSIYLSKIQIEPAKPKAPRPAPIAKPAQEPPPPVPAAEPEEAEPQPQAAAEQPEQEEVAESEGEAENDEVPLSPEAEQQKIRMMGFFAAVLEEAKGADLKFNTFGRFGFNLYLAGAADALGGVNGLERAEVARFVQDMLCLLKVPLDQARGFAFGFESYLSNARHLAMFEAGRRAMLPYLEGDQEEARQLVPAFQEWLDPSAKEEVAAPALIAVMFTDIVGSTGQTQAVGDLAAQYVIRTHNRIVRRALVSFGGREIKHTGDGIMASFVSAVGAVDAAIEIQRRVAAANAAEPDLPFPLHIRIGINAGEPVVEENDLFGATVQLAARVCNSCEADEIAITEVVHHLCAGKPLRLTQRGTELLKGFTEPVSLFTVRWQDEEQPPRAAEPPLKQAG